MNRVLIEGVHLDVMHVPALEVGQTRAPLVFLHEGLGSIAMWRDWPEMVCRATGRDAWVYSRRGYGESDAVPDVRGASNGRAGGRLQPDYLHYEALTVLPALLERLGLSAPVLVGHSDGASIALIHASRHPVTACVVMAPHVMVEDVSIQSIQEARQLFETGDLRARLARYHADVDGAFWQWNDAWLNPAFRHFDIRAECRHIAAPVLAIQGDQDPYGTLAQIDEIALPADQLTRVVLAGCGHSPHRDQTARTTRCVAEFLALRA
jgi:pimeloyl-ACP methyl ester carboxylesterase